MRELIIGFGEIGKAVQGAVCPNAKTYDINRKNYRIGNVDIMHICFPYSEKFVKQVKEYVVKFEPKQIAVWSTVPIGTCKKIGFGAVHTPVEGKHPELARSIELMTRWFGYNQDESGWFFKEYFEAKKMKVKAVASTDYTEALKLLSTTEYGVNLVYADFKAQASRQIGMPYELTKQWNKDYNKLYNDLMLPQFQKYILDAPDGIIGGHCIRENARILQEENPDFDNDILDLILEMRGTNGW